MIPKFKVGDYISSELFPCKDGVIWRIEGLIMDDRIYHSKCVKDTRDYMRGTHWHIDVRYTDGHYYKLSDSEALAVAL